METNRMLTPDDIDWNLVPWFCPDAAHRAAGGRCWYSWNTSLHVRCLTPAEEKAAPYNAALYHLGPGGEVRRDIAR